MRDLGDLRQRQSLPLEAKIHMSQVRIREWYDHFDGNVIVSFSGGKDSTVLAHLVHDLYPSVPLVFCNTGLEYPEIQEFARHMGAEFIRPKMRFDEVISNYGYPIITKAISESIYFARKIRNGEDKIETQRRRSNLTGTRIEFDKKCGKRDLLNGKGLTTKFNQVKWLSLTKQTQFMISGHCCHVMKKAPLKTYRRRTKSRAYVGTLAEESLARETAWIRNGCNAFEAKDGTSQPMSFWKEQDVLMYIKKKGVEISKAYGEVVACDSQGFEYEPLPGVECKLKCTGCNRTGCIFCGFGVHLEKGETRFQRLARTHPRQYEYCMNGGQWVDNPNHDPTAPKMDGDWENWNPKKIWVPSKEGLGMKKVFDDCNQIYGKDFIRYE